MARFVISHRLAGKTEAQKNASREALHLAAASVEKVIGRETPVSAADRPRLLVYLEAGEKDIENIRRQWSDDVIVEPEILRYTAEFSLRKYQAQDEFRPTRASSGLGTVLRITVRGSESPLERATATLFLQDALGFGTSNTIAETTDAEGNARFVYSPTYWVPSLLSIEPEQGFWPWFQVMPADGLVLNLPPLPKNGPIGWWHITTGMQRFGQERGQGIKIGVVDTGVGPHPYLDHVKGGGSVLEGKFDPNGGEDVTGHGSHVSGILAARPVEGSGEFCGVAAGAEVVVIRVFPQQGGANQGDIATAIDMLAQEHQVDLINMSLGSSQPSEIELDAIRLAADGGVVCIAAAGNSFGQPILYPAGYPEVAAVSALGLLGQYPAGSSPSFCVPQAADQFSGYLFLGNFCDVGAGMTCTAPGVGIISTVPKRKDGVVAAPYAAMSGTSMASPMATGSLASLLSACPEYRRLARGRERAQRASAVLLGSLVTIGLARNYQGGGLVHGWQG